MAQNDFEQRHLDTLDRDLNRFSALEQGFDSARCGLIGSVKKSVFSAQFNQLLVVNCKCATMRMLVEI